MTALSANTALPVRNVEGEAKYNNLVKTSSTVYHHALVMQTVAGKYVPGAISTTGSFAGLADIKNPSTVGPGIVGDGTLRVDVRSNIEVQIPLRTSVTVGLVGTAMYVYDDATVTNVHTTGASGPECGVLVEFTSANLGWVRLRAKALTKGI